MDEPQIQPQLRSIDQLDRELSRSNETKQSSAVAGEGRSWAGGGGGSDAASATYQTRPWITPGEGHRRLGYEAATADGGRLAMLLSCEPVWDLGRGEPVAEYIRERRRLASKPEGDAHPVEITPADDIRLEGLKFRRGLALLEEQGPGYGIMPTPWRVLARSRGPFAALNTGVRGRVDPAVRLIGEITDIPAGVDRQAVQEVVAFLASRRRTVMLRIPPDAEALDVVAGSGARGLCFPLTGPALETQGQSWARLTALLSAARKIAPMILLDHAPPERGDQLQEAGATHAVFAPMRSRMI